jgi:Ca-activated chloride channel family protein
VKLSETYPAKLPDLFHGGQVVVLARYTGQGATTVELTGKVGSEEKTFVYELKFPEKTGEERAFVEQLWARRKVGYLLDEIRRNGEKAELKDEVIKLAKKHGITTPYTSYLVVPDVATPTPPVTWANPQRAPGAAARTRFLHRGLNQAEDPAPTPDSNVGTPLQTFQSGSVTTIRPHGASFSGSGTTTEYAPAAPMQPSSAPVPTGDSPAFIYAQTTQLKEALKNGQANTGKLGVDLAVTLEEMRTNCHVGQTKARRAAGRTCNEVSGVWVDDGYDAKMATVRVKALSAAYFKLLQKQASLGEVFKLGTRVIWVTPSGTALVIDPTAGEESISDEQIEQLFRAKK